MTGTLSLLSIKHFIRDCQTLYCLTIQVLLFASGPICVFILHWASILTGSNFVFILSRFDLLERFNIIVLQGVGVLNMHDGDMFYPHDITHRGGPMVQVSLVQRLNIGYHGDASPLYRTIELFQKKKERGKQEYCSECSQLDNTCV